MRYLKSSMIAVALFVGASALARPPRAPEKPLPNLPKDRLCAAGMIPGYYNPQDLGEPPTLSAPSAALFDFDTGEMLWGKNPDVKRFPASTTILVRSAQPENA